MARPVAFEYAPSAGFLHRLHPFIKFASMAAISIYALGSNFPVLILLSLGIFLISLLGGITPRKLLAGSSPILLTTVLLVGLGALDLRSLTVALPVLFSGLRLLWAIGISFAAASIFFYTTKISEIREALEVLEDRCWTLTRTLKWRLTHRPMLERLHQGQQQGQHPYLRFSLLFSLTLSFIPQVFFEWSQAEEAWRGRGGKGGIPMLLHMVPLIMERLILSAQETAHALELRIGR